MVNAVHVLGVGLDHHFPPLCKKNIGLACKTGGGGGVGRARARREGSKAYQHFG